MAQIKCNECGKSFSDSLNECPNCGCPVKEENYGPTMIGISFPKEKKKPNLTCGNCGNKIEESFKVCPYCGESLTEAKSETSKKALKKKDTIICEECGFEFEKGLETCPECGCPTKENTPTEVVAPKEEIAVAVPKRGRPKKEKLVTCQECGFEFKEGLEACPECGYPAEGKAPTEVVTPKEEIAVEVPKRGRPKKEKLIACQECGFEFAESLDKCPECGYPVKEAETISTPVAEVPEIKAEPVKVKKAKKSNAGKVVFYIFIVLFFIGGCATAVLIYDKIQDDKDDQNSKVQDNKDYKINRTISCKNNEGSEERNYYFSDKKLVKYSSYTNKTYYSEEGIEVAMDGFQNRFDKNGNEATIRFNRNGLNLESILIFDLQKSKKGLVMEEDITKDYSPAKVRETMEDANWVCQETDKDLGESLPLNELKSAKERLEEYLIRENYAANYDTKNNITRYSKNDDNENVVIDLTNGTYTYSEINYNKTVVIIYNYLKGIQDIEVSENGNIYELDYNLNTKKATCIGDENWCSLHSSEYISDDALDVEEDFNEILKDAKVSLKDLKRD